MLGTSDAWSVVGLDKRTSVLYFRLTELYSLKFFDAMIEKSMTRTKFLTKETKMFICYLNIFTLMWLACQYVTKLQIF